MDGVGIVSAIIAEAFPLRVNQAMEISSGFLLLSKESND